MEEGQSQIYGTQMTQLCVVNLHEINNIVHKVNDAGRIRLLTLNARKKTRMVVGDEIANVSIGIGRETSSDAVII